jgi:hypothetical protein
MIQQPTFWDSSGTITTTTRAAALVSVEQLRPAMREIVYEFIRGRGALGAIDEEVEELAASLGKRESTGRARRVELSKEGRIIAASHTRKTRSNRDATVWIAADQPLG